MVTMYISLVEVLGMTMGVKEFSTLVLTLILLKLPYWVTLDREEDNVLSSADLDSSIEARGCVAEVDMVALLVPESNIGNVRFLMVSNGCK